LPEPEVAPRKHLDSCEHRKSGWCTECKAWIGKVE
jgi:hypothetical protein